MSDEICIFIPDIVVKPYVRMTRRGKWGSPQAQEYLASRKHLQMLFKNYLQMYDLTMLPEQTPIDAVVAVDVPSEQGHRADLDNIVKAVFDAGNKILYPDDCWIDHLIAMRMIGDHSLYFWVRVR